MNILNIFINILNVEINGNWSVKQIFLFLVSESIYAVLLV